MQNQAGFNLGCTANDVQIASATIYSIDDPCEFRGDSVTFTAQFDVVVTAKERFDIGLYFAIDGDPNTDGAISGTCSISTMDPTSVDVNGESQFVDLDDFPNTGDSCGDITKKSNPLQPLITITTECIDTDRDGFLNLPNCTSWRQSGANEVCTSPIAAFPGSPSKCRCDLGFQVDVPVPPAVLTVDKVANPTSVEEPGGQVAFTVTVTNDAIDPTNIVTVDSVFDCRPSVFVEGVCQNPIDVSASCLDDNGLSLVGQQIPATQSLTCSFTADVSGDADYAELDTVTVSGTDANNQVVEGEDDATVTITDVLPVIAVIKDASTDPPTEPPQVGEGGEPVTFTVVVSNNSVETVDITSLIDCRPSVFVDGVCQNPIDVGATCLDTNGVSLVGQTIGVGGSLTCTFPATVGAGEPGSETDTVTATAVDNEGNEDSAADSATVIINDEPSMLSLTKTPSPTSVDEPGENVTFTILVKNTSLVDSVDIDTLSDTIYGDLSAKCAPSIIGQTLLPGATVSCSFTEFVAGNGNTSETNVATVEGTDDDGVFVDAMGDATVNIDNVDPSAALVKVAKQATVTYEVTITNNSVDGDPLTVDELVDSVYGDIGSTCRDDSSVPLVGQTIAVGSFKSCTFDADVLSDEVGNATVTDVVTGTLTDDENSAVTPAPTDTATVTLGN